MNADDGSCDGSACLIPYRLMSRHILLLQATLALSVLAFSGCAARADRSAVRIDPNKLLDLSYSYGADTIYWPTAQPFKMQRVAYGRTPGGYFYFANNISTAEHGGTHMDAPLHFAEGRRTTDLVPLSDCIGRACVLDVS